MRHSPAVPSGLIPGIQRSAAFGSRTGFVGYVLATIAASAGLGLVLALLPPVVQLTVVVGGIVGAAVVLFGTTSRQAAVIILCGSLFLDPVRIPIADNLFNIKPAFVAFAVLCPVELIRRNRARTS